MKKIALLLLIAAGSVSAYLEITVTNNTKNPFFDIKYEEIYPGFTNTQYIKKTVKGQATPGTSVTGFIKNLNPNALYNLVIIPMGMSVTSRKRLKIPLVKDSSEYMNNPDLLSATNAVKRNFNIVTDASGDLQIA